MTILSPEHRRLGRSRRRNSKNQFQLTGIACHW